MLNDLPTGTITFLFTDIEGSTQLWERHPEAMKAALARHDELLHRAIESHHGRVVKTTGDGCHAVFASATDAVAAVIDAQRTFHLTHDRPLSTEHSPLIRVRMGFHTGEAELRDGDYYGSAVNRAARIMSIGHGGQVLISATTAGLIRDNLPPGVSLRDLGEHRLRDLSRPSHIYQVVVGDLPGDFPALKSLDANPGNLPVLLTSFVGRERELAEVKRLLATTRLLTLTGPGGTGKTRLSLQAAADLQTGFAHGAWLVELAPLADPALVPGAVAALFSLSPQPGLSLSDALHDYLRGKHLLLVLDNCEHLVEACAWLAADLLAVAPRLTILASSREGLGIAGETTYHVPTLALPAASDLTAAAVCRHDAADLFLQRARAARPNFAVTNANAPAIAQIVRRLDGIPLAIELAAARVKLLSPEQIAARLDDRFRLLTGGSRTALPRQQTLRALIDWSYDLLDEAEQWFFRQMGVFIGGWTLEAAEYVAELSGFQNLTGLDALDLLAGLVNKSLVIVDEGETETRYRYLETVRQYARDKLFESGEGEAARDRHAAYYDRAVFTTLGLVSMTGGIGSMSMRPIFNVARWMHLVEKDIDNLRAAVEWTVTRNLESGLLMAVTLALALSAARLGDGTPAVREALAALDTLPLTDDKIAARWRELRTLAYLALANHSLAMGDTVSAIAEYTEAERLARLNHNQGLLARALVQRSLSAAFLNDDSTITTAHEAAALFRELGDSTGETQAIGQLSTFYLRRGDRANAMPLADQTKAMLETSDDPLIAIYWYLGAPQLARAEGDIPKAEKLYREGWKIFQGMKNRGFALRYESELAHMLRQEGRNDDARPVYCEAIREWQNLGRRAAVANMLENFSFLARAEDDPHRAARLLGAAEAIRDEIHVDMTPWEREEYNRELILLREELPSSLFAAEWAAGRSMTLDEAVDYAVKM